MTSTLMVSQLMVLGLSNFKSNLADFVTNEHSFNYLRILLKRLTFVHTSANLFYFFLQSGTFSFAMSKWPFLF